MTSLMSRAMVQSPERRWLVGLRDDLEDLLDFTADRAGLEEDVQLKVKDVLYRLRDQEDSDRFHGRDPYLVDQLWSACFAAALALSDSTEQNARSSLRINLERARQALRDMLDQSAVDADRPAKEVARWLVDHSEVSEAELADLIGAEVTDLQQWASPSNPSSPTGDQATSLRTLARTINSLRHLMTASGAVRWLATPNQTLEGGRPRDLLDTPEAAARVLRVASDMRATVAA